MNVQEKIADINATLQKKAEEAGREIEMYRNLAPHFPDDIDITFLHKGGYLVDFMIRLGKEQSLPTLSSDNPYDITSMPELLAKLPPVPRVTITGKDYPYKSFCSADRLPREAREGMEQGKDIGTAPLFPLTIEANYGAINSVKFEWVTQCGPYLMEVNFHAAEMRLSASRERPETWEHKGKGPWRRHYDHRTLFPGSNIAQYGVNDDWYRTVIYWHEANAPEWNGTTMRSWFTKEFWNGRR